MDPKRLLDQFLGPDTPEALRRAGTTARDKLAASGLGGFAGGAAAGGLLALLLGNKQIRKAAGGIVGYGGAAALGALAYRAYQNWQQGRAPQEAPAASPADVPANSSRFLPSAAPAKDGSAFELTLILAIVAAANADGHIGADEQRRIFEQVGRAGLGAEEKAFVFDALSRPPDLDALAARADGPEQAAEIYLAARLAVDPDHPAERGFLEALAHKLALPGGLVEHLEQQAGRGFAADRQPAQIA